MKLSQIRFLPVLCTVLAALTPFYTHADAEVSGDGLAVSGFCNALSKKDYKLARSIYEENTISIRDACSKDYRLDSSGNLFTYLVYKVFNQWTKEASPDAIFFMQQYLRSAKDGFLD